LRFFDRPNDLGERGFFADFDGLDAQNPVFVDSGPGDGVPGFFSTGMLSPVSIDSSTDDTPSITTPSTGIFSPGRTSTISPTMTSAAGTVISFPSRTTRAVFAPSFINVRIACDVRPLAIASNSLPMRTSVIKIAAVS